MNFSWTSHRFVGGALALDVANSVILRFDPMRSIDRFAAPEQLAGFLEAATTFCAERALFGELAQLQPHNLQIFLRLREAIDRHFRAAALGMMEDIRLADVLEASADILRGARKGSLEAATVHSTLRLLAPDETARLKICGNCGWLFIDRSRNRSRMWCDMAVCGNRVKASRHYHRSKKEQEP
jgi:predicted RNA-binding Zn ribbon-like protein